MMTFWGAWVRIWLISACMPTAWHADPLGEMTSPPARHWSQPAGVADTPGSL
jgi:hypothetical protein